MSAQISSILVRSRPGQSCHHIGASWLKTLPTIARKGGPHMNFNDQRMLWLAGVVVVILIIWSVAS